MPTTSLFDKTCFVSLIPDRPYCVDVVGDRLKIRDKRLALQHRHIQLNGPASFRWMPHDIDRADAYFAHRDANLPEPNFIAINPENGHGHCAILLAVPVARHSASRIEPLRFYGAVERGIARRLGADRGYAGLITKNPLHPHWRVEWRRDEPYTLPELADWLFFEDMRPDPSIETTFGAGRNVTVFDELRQIAYREVLSFKRAGSIEAWFDRCLRLAVGINQQFPQPMRLSEVRAIAKSVVEVDVAALLGADVLTASVAARQARQCEAVGWTSESRGCCTALAGAPTTAARRRERCRSRWWHCRHIR